MPSTPPASDMLTRHWIRAALVLLYLLALLWVLSQSDRLSELATSSALPPPAPPSTTGKPADQQSKPSLAERARQRAEERKTHERKLAARRAEYRRLEADLAQMAAGDIPAALEELALAAAAFKRKLPDLKRLTKEERQDREAPVKEALARARALTADYYAADREAQKGREGPTLHSPADIYVLTERTQAFKKGEEEIGAFAKALAPLHGKVPESLLLAAFDAITRWALPAEAFDPCRDPAACPKPPPPSPPQPPPTADPAPPPTNRFLPGAPQPPRIRPAPVGPTFCADRKRLAPRRWLPLREEPSPDAPIVARIPAGACGLAPTGRRGFFEHPFGRTRWLEVTDAAGNRGWAPDADLERHP